MTTTHRECLACKERYSNESRFCEICGMPLSLVSSQQAPNIIANRYEIIKEVGKGAMGIVYLAHDTLLRRDVALKVLLPSNLRNETAAKRLLREARAAGRIAHPNVIQIFDAGFYAKESQPFMVMEYLQGKTLKDIFEENQGLPWADLYPIARQIAQALAAAHAQDVVHRDLKPANVFLQANLEDVHIKLLDFGLSKLQSYGRGSGSVTRLTEVGAILGTPLYMSPEQVRGDSVGFSADIYGFAVMLYRGLTGQFPFLARNAVELYRKILQGNPASMRSVAPDRNLPEALDKVILSALSLDPKQRPASAAEMLRQLDQTTPQHRAMNLSVRLGLEPPQIQPYVENESEDDSPKTLLEIPSYLVELPEYT
jgi:serine/threonine protein kinase